MMVVRPALLALATASLAGCAASAERERQIDAPPARVVGDAVNCVTASRIENTVVHDDYTIDFEMTGGRTYRNTLPNRCASLGFERSFGYELSTSQLCNVDTITVLYSNGQPGATCGLGQFVPVELIEPDEEQ